ANGGYYQDVFPQFSGPVFVKTSWSHAASTPANNNCNSPYYAIIIQNCIGEPVTTGSVEFYYKSAQSYISTNNQVRTYFEKNPTWFTTTQYLPGDNTYNNKIKVSFSNLQVGERRAIYIPLAHNNLSVNQFVETKVDVTFNSILNPCNGKGDGSSFFHTSQVRANPHDPNYIEVAPSCLSLYHGSSMFETTRILYTIHFQNEGLGDAINIKIVDFLSKFVEPSTAYVVDSKFPVSEFYIDNNRDAIIKFNGVNLPGTQNPLIMSNSSYIERTKGWVKLAVCTRNIPGPAFYDALDPQCVENYAAIYFDTQAPIYTGMATTCESAQCTLTVAEINELNGLYGCLSAPNFRSSSDKETELTISPNPFDNELILVDDMLFGDCEVSIHNIQGQKIFNSKIQKSLERRLKIETETFQQGFYIVTIQNQDEKKSMKVIKQ
ncbi:MAG: hypothetical protein RLZZ546_3166, partial [Bacteroidota bacterium]